MEEFLNLYDNSSTLTKVIINAFCFIVAIQMSRIYFWKNKAFQLIAILVLYALYYFIIEFFTAIPVQHYLFFYVLPSFLFSIIFFIVTKIIRLYKKENIKPLIAKIPFTKGKDIEVDTVKGVSIQGAAGSGKTILASWLLDHYAKNNVGGLLYDYKDFEFVEMALSFYKNSEVPVQVFAPHKPQQSIRYNPIALDVIKSHEDIKVMSKCILDNILSDEEKRAGKFFVDVAEGAITGAIYRLKEDYPRYCSFTYLAAVFLTKDAEELVSFIEKSRAGSIHARAFLDSADSARQMAGVKATLSKAFSNFANPNIFYTLETNSVDFSINESHNKSLFCIVNKPSYDDIYSPVLSVVVQSIIIKMSERNREPSFILLDEAPTLKINRIGKVPATMRSFGVATIYMLQDTVQATIQMGKDRMREIFANLSTICFGKTNDPETARFFENYFSEISVKQKSTSFKAGALSSGDKRMSVSERKEKEHKSYEMFKRKAGEFFIFDEKGKSYDGRIQMPVFEPEQIHTINKISTLELEHYYNEILKKAEKLI